MGQKGPVRQAAEKLISFFADRAIETSDDKMGRCVAEACRCVERGTPAQAMVLLAECLPGAGDGNIARVVLCARHPAVPDFLRDRAVEDVGGK